MAEESNQVMEMLDESVRSFRGELDEFRMKNHYGMQNSKKESE